MMQGSNLFSAIHIILCSSPVLKLFKVRFRFVFYCTVLHCIASVLFESVLNELN